MLRPLVLCYAARNACGFVTPATSSTKLAPLRSGGPPVVERPAPEILLSARDDQTQQLGFAAICGGIAVGTVACVAGLDALESVLPDGWFGTWRDYTWPLPLGGIFAAAGVAHFTLADAFMIDRTDAYSASKGKAMKVTEWMDANSYFAQSLLHSALSPAQVAPKLSFDIGSQAAQLQFKSAKTRARLFI